MITLLGKPTSINVRKVLWVCEELQLPVDLQPWGSGHRSTQVPEFLALNPNGLVPVLIETEAETEGAGEGREEGTAGRRFVLWESNTICRYLAGRQGRADLLPSAPQPRARVEQWMDWQATELNNAWRYAFMALVRQSPLHTDAAALQASVDSWNQHMMLLDAQLQRTGAFVAGETFTLADVVLGVSACRWQRAPMARPALAGVAAWQQRLAAHSGYRLHGDNGMV